MEKNKSEGIFIFSSSSAAAPPPSPIPTGTGSRSAASPTLSEQIDKAIRIPKLVLPQNVHPEEINYDSLVKRDKNSIRRLLRSAREFGVFRIVRHGISTQELTLALGKCERIFGLMVDCCTTQGDHEKLLWSDHGDRILKEASDMVGRQNFRNFRQTVEKVENQLEAMAEELRKVMGQNARKQSKEDFKMGESTMSIYRFHRANLIDQYSSVIGEAATQVSVPYALSLHLLPESAEFSLCRPHTHLSFVSSPDTVIVTIGKDFEEWSLGEFKSAQGALAFKPFLHTSTPSFSIERKWPSVNKIISIVDQITILLIAVLVYTFLYHMYSN